MGEIGLIHSRRSTESPTRKMRTGRIFGRFKGRVMVGAMSLTLLTSIPAVFYGCKRGQISEMEQRRLDGQFLQAVKEGNIEKAGKLLDRKADVNACDDNGIPALMHSIEGQTEMTRFLLENGAYVDIEDSGGRTPLMRAATDGCLEMAALFVEYGADVNAKDNAGMTPLMHSSSQNQTDTARFLLENGADVNARDNSGGTALIGAAGRGHTETIGLLIEKGADVNAKDAIGATAAMDALVAGHRKVVRLLWKHGGKIY